MDDSQLLLNTLILGALLFAIGTIGFVSRRNLIVMMLSAGMMLQGITLTLAAFSSFHREWSGQLLALFALALTAIEGALALALIILFVRREHSFDISIWQTLRDPAVPLDRGDDLEPDSVANEAGETPQLEIAAVDTNTEDRSAEVAP